MGAALLPRSTLYAFGVGLRRKRPTSKACWARRGPESPKGSKSLGLRRPLRGGTAHRPKAYGPASKRRRPLGPARGFASSEYVLRGGGPLGPPTSSTYEREAKPREYDSPMSAELTWARPPSLVEYVRDERGRTPTATTSPTASSAKSRRDFAPPSGGTLGTLGPKYEGLTALGPRRQLTPRRGVGGGAEPAIGEE